MTGIYDVTEAFDDLYEPVSISKHAPGGYVNGQWVEAAATSVFARAVPHPMSTNKTNALNIDGYLGGELLRFYFEDVYVANVSDNPTRTTGDAIIYDGKTYLILKKDDWKKIGGFFILYAERNEN